MERKFKVGDRVKFKSWHEMEKEYGVDDDGDIKNSPYFTQAMRHLCGTYATIKELNGSIVALKDFSSSGDTDWRYAEFMLKQEQQTDKLIFRDNVTILIKDGKRYVAKCCKGDTYDKEKGLLVCLAKASGYTFDDLQKMLEDAEDQDGKTNNTVKEVQRAAKVGEYIKIVNARQNQNRHGKGFAYQNGDILKVKELRICGNVTTYTKKGKGSNLTYADYNYIYDNEYVVLENYKPNKYKITLSEFLSQEVRSVDKFVINIKTTKEYNQFIKACQKKGYFENWFRNDASHFIKDDFCISYNFVCKEGFCDKKWFLTKGAKVYNFNEVDLNN